MTSPQYISFNLTSNKFICTCSAMLSTIIANFQMKTTHFSGIPCLSIVDRLLGGCLHSENYLAAHWSKVTQISLKLKLLTFWHLLEISLSSSFTAIWMTLDELRACVWECARARLRCKLLANIQTMMLFVWNSRARWLNGKENIKQTTRRLLFWSCQTKLRARTQF